jgi:hypothetical protein
MAQIVVSKRGVSTIWCMEAVAKIITKGIQ